MAKKQQPEAFAVLASAYLDFINEFLALSGYANNRPKRLLIASDIFLHTWRQLPLLHRVSDLERVLSSRLLAFPEGSEPVVSKNVYLPQLTPERRFAIAAQDFENWGYDWCALALRIPQRDFPRLLCEARCQLLGYGMSSEKTTKESSLETVSNALDQIVPLRSQRKLSHTICQNSNLADFKIRWLSFRCDLIDWRQEMRLSPEELSDFLSGLIPQLHPGEMITPPLLQRLSNRLAYSDRNLQEAVNSCR